MTKVLVEASFSQEMLDRFTAALSDMPVPTQFLIQHRQVITALAGRSNGATTASIGALTGLLAATSAPDSAALASGGATEASRPDRFRVTWRL
jgi:hypothetical protein